MTEQIIIDGCEFQSDCIEYKDISYLKIMPICAIHELSIACHDKVNKCKYYKLYIQLKHKEQKFKKLISQGDKFEFGNNILEHERNKYKQTLTEIKEIVGIGLVDGLQPEEYSGFLKTLQAQILQKINSCNLESNEENN